MDIYQSRNKFHGIQLSIGYRFDAQSFSTQVFLFQLAITHNLSTPALINTKHVHSIKRSIFDMQYCEIANNSSIAEVWVVP